MGAELLKRKVVKEVVDGKASTMPGRHSALVDKEAGTVILLGARQQETARMEGATITQRGRTTVAIDGDGREWQLGCGCGG